MLQKIAQRKNRDNRQLEQLHTETILGTTQTPLSDLSRDLIVLEELENWE